LRTATRDQDYARPQAFSPINTGSPCSQKPARLLSLWLQRPAKRRKAKRTASSLGQFEAQKRKERGGKQVTKGREQTMRLFSHGS